MCYRQNPRLLKLPPHTYCKRSCSSFRGGEFWSRSFFRRRDSWQSVYHGARSDDITEQSREDSTTQRACTRVHHSGPRALSCKAQGVTPGTVLYDRAMIHTRAREARLDRMFGSLPVEVVHIILRWVCDDDVDECWTFRRLTYVFTAPRVNTKQVLTPTTTAVIHVSKQYNALLSLPLIKLGSHIAYLRIGFVIDVVVCFKLRGFGRCPGVDLFEADRMSRYPRILDFLYWSVFYFCNYERTRFPVMRRPSELGPEPPNHWLLNCEAAYQCVVASRDTVLAHFNTPWEKQRVAVTMAGVFWYLDNVFVAWRQLQPIRDVLSP